MPLHTNPIQIPVASNRNELRVIFGPCHLVECPDSGALTPKRPTSAHSVVQLAIFSNSDRQLLLHWWSATPPVDELIWWVIDGAQRLLGREGGRCILPTTLTLQFPELVPRLADVGVETKRAMHASDAGVSALRSSRDVVALLISLLAADYSEGPPTVVELNALSTTLPGWMHLSRQQDPDGRIRQSKCWAERIRTLRQRDGTEAQLFQPATDIEEEWRVRRGPKADWLEAFSQRAAMNADPVALSLAKRLRAWSDDPSCLPTEVTEDVGRYLVRSFLERQRANRSRWLVGAGVLDSEVEHGSIWEQRLSTCVANALAVGLEATPNRWLRHWQLHLKLEPTDRCDGDWLRDLPECHVLRRELREATQSETVVHQVRAHPAAHSSDLQAVEMVRTFETSVESLRRSRWLEPPAPEKLRFAESADGESPKDGLHVDLLLIGPRPIQLPDDFSPDAWLFRARERMKRLPLGCRLIGAEFKRWDSARVLRSSSIDAPPVVQEVGGTDSG